MRSGRENPATTLKFTRIVIQNSSFSGLSPDYGPSPWTPGESQSAHLLRLLVLICLPVRDAQCQAQNRFGFHSPSVLAAFQRTTRDTRLCQMAIMSGAGRNLISLVNHSPAGFQTLSLWREIMERFGNMFSLS
jgi:hypothetical protein